MVIGSPDSEDMDFESDPEELPGLNEQMFLGDDDLDDSDVYGPPVSAYRYLKQAVFADTAVVLVAAEAVLTSLLGAEYLTQIHDCPAGCTACWLPTRGAWHGVPRSSLSDTPLKPCNPQLACCY